MWYGRWCKLWKIHKLNVAYTWNNWTATLYLLDSDLCRSFTAFFFTSHSLFKRLVFIHFNKQFVNYFSFIRIFVSFISFRSLANFSTLIFIHRRGSALVLLGIFHIFFFPSNFNLLPFPNERENNTESQILVWRLLRSYGLWMCGCVLNWFEWETNTNETEERRK